MSDKTTDLLARLRQVDPPGEGERTRWMRNPDGLEAAAEIERLRAALREILADPFISKRGTIAREALANG
jgi:hypothetical protein